MSDHITASSPTTAETLASSDDSQLRALVQFHQAILDSLPMMISVYEVVDYTTFRMVSANRATLQWPLFAGMDLIGKTIDETVRPEEVTQLRQQFQVCVTSRASIEFENDYTYPNNDVLWLSIKFIPITGAAGQVTHIVTVHEDISARKQQEQATRQLQETVISQQQATLAELSTPLLTISDQTVVMPLVGTVDSRRVQTIMEALLTGVAATRATKVILDITGVAVVDTQVANAFLRASQAVALLGAKVIITGIRPEVAQTLVGLGVDLQSIITRSSLQSGIAYALKN